MNRTPIQTAIDSIAEGQTGCLESDRLVRRVLISIGTYEVLVNLGEYDRFLGIKEIRIARDFLSHEQVAAHIKAIDVRDFYEDEEEE